MGALSFVGFKAMLGWHYVVLFSPLLIGPVEQGFYSFFFQRQLVLYLSLAVSFALFVVLGRAILRRNRTMFSRALVVGVGVVATLATVCSAPLFGLPPQARLVAAAFLGLTEAALMLLWLHYYIEAAKGHLIRSFVADMICGAAVAVLLCCFEVPIGEVATVVLPVVATVSLVACWTAAPAPEPLEGAPREDAPDKLSRRAMAVGAAKTLLPTAVYAVAFGALQGAFLASDIALLMANNFLVLFGIVIAGLVILLLAHGRRVRVSIDAIHRCSLLLFVVGIVGLPFASSLENAAGGGFSFAKSPSWRGSTCSTSEG